jgi:hypothetical protein
MKSDMLDLFGGSRAQFLRNATEETADSTGAVT